MNIMTIEVKQLLIKSSVQGDSGGQAEHSTPPTVDYDALKDEVIAECKTMLSELLREKRER